MGLIMDTLPDISQSCVQMAITWHLGRAQPDAVGQQCWLSQVCFYIIYGCIRYIIIQGFSTLAFKVHFPAESGSNLDQTKHACNFLVILKDLD